MPKVVDHEERRQQIVDGLLDLAGRVGLHAVTLRGVADEAGVSLRLVQYYFADKSELLSQALLRLERLSHQRWNKRLAELPDLPSLRSYLEAFFAESLPTDKASKDFHRIWTSFAMLAKTDGEFGKQSLVSGPKRLAVQLAGRFSQAKFDGQLSRDVVIPVEVTRLLALNHGLGTGIQVGFFSVKQAKEVVNLHLDQLLGLDGRGETDTGKH